MTTGIKEKKNDKSTEVLSQEIIDRALRMIKDNFSLKEDMYLERASEEAPKSMSSQKFKDILKSRTASSDDKQRAKEVLAKREKEVTFVAMGKNGHKAEFDCNDIRKTAVYFTVGPDSSKVCGFYANYTEEWTENTRSFNFN